MSFAVDIPHFYCYVRAEFLYDLVDHFNELIPVCVFGVDSVEGQAIGFDIMTDFGGQFARLPIHSLCWREDAPLRMLSSLELWNNFSYDIEAHEYGYLRQLACQMYTKQTHSWETGRYMFTLSWKGSRYAEDPGEGGFKRAHIIKLDDGNFAAQPNNRLRWHEPSFITQPFPDKPAFRTNSYVWNAENEQIWRTSEGPAYFYDDKEV